MRLFFPSPAAIIILLASWLLQASSINAQTLRQPGVTLIAKNWNSIQLQDDHGTNLLTLTGFHVKWTPNVRTTGGSIREITTTDGVRAIEVVYELNSNKSSEIQLIGRFTPRPGQVDVCYILTGLPSDPKIGGSMFGRQLPAAKIEFPAQKMGHWQRHAHGGQPQEHPDGQLVRYRIGDQLVSFAFDIENKVNATWRDSALHHTAFVKSSASDAMPGTWESNFSILLTPADWPAEAIIARKHGRSVGLHIGTDQTYNWWTASPSGKDSAVAEGQPPIALKSSVVNTTDAPRIIVLKYWARDFAGNLVVEQKRTIQLSPGELLSESIPVAPSHASVDPTREIFFAEVSVSDKDTGEELAFARTNIALLLPHEFKDASTDSIFGIAAYWPFPNESSVQRLMERMGVRWSRHGNTHDYKNITAIRHSQIPQKRHEEDPSSGDKWIREQLQLCIDHANPAWEFGNEINYSVMSIGMGDTVKDRERALRIGKYLGWVKAIRRIQAEMGPPAANVKLLSVGLAGMDVRFADAIHEAGGWELLDGLALHPGRGNFTPDYPVSEPWQNWKSGAFGSYWNFYGSIKTAANLVKTYSSPEKPKELWLTEVYSCSYPNSFWEDSLRHGAENALLSFALAKSENVKALMWYQLMDSVWHDKLGVNPKDREYYFGLLNRDLSFKPALLAYITSAEELDQAKFIRWLHFSKPENARTRGLLFETPRGPMAVLWDRSDGYILTQKTEKFASPEPWMDTWHSHVPVLLPVASDIGHITVINPIGQRQRVAAQATARGFNTTLQLTGAPVIVYGLDTARLD